MRERLTQLEFERQYQAMFEWVAIADIQFDTYQRGVVDKHCGRIATDFDAAFFDPMRVNRRRDGTLWGMDCRQRVEAMSRIGLTHAPCLVTNGLTPAQEARFFLRLNNGRSPVTPWKKFQAGLESDNEVALAVQAIAAELGFSLGPNANTGRRGINCVGTLVTICR